MKKIIINADDFGYSKDTNEAILLGYNSDIITSCSLIANMEGFQDAVEVILPQMRNIDVGFHFNIVEGQSLTKSNLLCDKNGVFNNNYLQLINKSKNTIFKKQIEDEFRSQLEKILKHTQITHIDSHMHTLAIPELFEITCNLAKEYGIRYIRTQREIPYITLNKIFSYRFPINIVKNILLNAFTNQNLAVLNKFQIDTNSYFIGVLYTGYMDETAIINGLKKIKDENSITEVIFHPSLNKKKRNNYKEFLITQNPHFKEHLQNTGFTLSKYSN